MWEAALHNPYFSQYAAPRGAFGVRVMRAGEIDGALAAAIAHDGPALVEVIAGPDPHLRSGPVS